MHFIEYMTEDKHKAEDDNMNSERAAEVLSILMGSDLYFDFPLEERLEIVKRILAKMA